MEAGFSTVDLPDQQTVDPRMLVANRDSTSVPVQPDNPGRLRDTGFDPIEPRNDASSTTYNKSGATGFACDGRCASLYVPQHGRLEFFESLRYVLTPRPRGLSGMLT